MNTPEPHVFGQRLVYDLLIKNEGGQTLMNIDFQIGTDARDLTYVSNDCGLGNLSNSSTWVEWGRPIAVLEPGAAFPCTVSYDIATQSATGFITARVVAFNIDDYDPLNNTYSVAIQANQTPAP
ncbi:hypothetical protein [Dokdonella sp.]|uniref:hypothetical protein n=1 Tax=Dokdonella sp. TaxID=2291710 RepID=UPI0035290150